MGYFSLTFLINWVKNISEMGIFQNQDDLEMYQKM